MNPNKDMTANKAMALISQAKIVKTVNSGGADGV